MWLGSSLVTESTLVKSQSLLCRTPRSLNTKMNTNEKNLAPDRHYADVVALC